MPQSTSAPPLGAEAQLVPLCKACQESAGLCVSCAERDLSILPQLAQEAWHKDAHTGPLGKNPEPVVERPEPTPEERFEAKKKARANAKAASKLHTQLAGGFTRARPKRNAA